MGRLTRRTALIAPLALGGCGLWDDWFGTHKTPLPGKREPVVAGRKTLRVDEGTPKVELDPATVSGPLHGLQIALPRWSPDGSQIALIGGLMSDQGSTGGDIYLLSAEGGQPVDVTPGITIIATLIGGTLLGLIGALVAIPMAATIQLLLEEVATPRQNQR